MRLHIQRFYEGRKELRTYELKEGGTLLEMLEQIKTKEDATLSFTHECRSGVCGSCAVRAGGVEVLACAYTPKEDDLIEPLRFMPIKRDLIVDRSAVLTCNARAQAAMEMGELVKVSAKEARANALQSDCILCGSCYSACPVLEVKPEFLGPFALTRVWRYVSDVRENDVAGKIEAVQQAGIWDCTLCNACVPVCPQGIAPKQDIMMLRNKSGVMGHMDPNIFGGDFGFGGMLEF